MLELRSSARVLCSCSVTKTWPHGLQPARLLCSWSFPGQSTGVGSHFLLQRIFPTQGSNPYLLHWQAGSLTPEPPGRPQWRSHWDEIAESAVLDASLKALGRIWLPWFFQLPGTTCTLGLLLTSPFLQLPACNVRLCSSHVVSLWPCCGRHSSFFDLLFYCCDYIRTA